MRHQLSLAFSVLFLFSLGAFAQVPRLAYDLSGEERTSVQDFGLRNLGAETVLAGGTRLARGAVVTARVNAPALDGRSRFETYAISGTGMSFAGKSLRLAQLRGDGSLELKFGEGESLVLTGMGETASGSKVFQVPGSTLGLRVLADGSLLGGGLRGKAPGLASLRSWPPSFAELSDALLGLRDLEEGLDRRGDLEIAVNRRLPARPAPLADSSAETREARRPEGLESEGIAGALSERVNDEDYEARPQPPGSGRQIDEGLNKAVAGGAELGRGDKGAAIAELQRRLSKLGYTAPVTGQFDNDTEWALRRFQEKNGVAKTGRLGKTTLAALSAAESAPAESELGRRLASAAAREAQRRNTVGRCYAGVADAVDAVLPAFLYGRSAYMAADQLASHGRFKEVRGLRGEALRKLPAGAIVVWGKTALSPHGHISVALGDGREASDHISTQLTSLRGDAQPRVFLPR